jgi:flagellar hook-basal body complex protein FliE
MDGIKGIGSKPIEIAGKAGAQGTGENADFANALKDAISKVNGAQQEADMAVKQLAEGKATIHETMIAIEKAGISFDLMLQVRNKIVTAYEDIMRTQV